MASESANILDSTTSIDGIFNENEDDLIETTNNNGFHDVGKIIAIVLGVLLILYLIRLFVQGLKYRNPNRIDGKVVIITGCNTGIGKATAMELAKRGGKIYMACRDSKKCEEARLEIMSETQNTNIFNRNLDLSSLESIRNFVKKFLEEETRLDILINNAGVMGVNSNNNRTKDGFEIHIGVNHIGHFYLTNLLLDTLKASAPSRIVVVTSLIYIFGRIKRHDLNSEKNYSRFGAYGQSKLANILFTRQLAKKLDGTKVTVNCCHPGIVKTELSRNFMPDILKRLLAPIILFLFKTPDAGAQTSLRLALDPDLENVSGQYFSDCIKFPILPNGKNEELAEWLWKTSEQWTGLSKATVIEDTTINMKN